VYGFILVTHVCGFDSMGVFTFVASQGAKSGLDSVLISSQARFPLQFSLFVQLLISLSSHKSGAYNVVGYLKTLSLFSQPFNESCPGGDIDITSDEQVWQVTVPRIVCRSGKLTIQE
jgi:hypothetical protein